MKTIIPLLLLIIISHTSISQSCIVIDEFNPTLTNTITEAEYTSFPWYSDSTFLDTYYNTLVQRFGGAAVRSDIESVWLRVPVVFWVYRNDDGSPGADLSRPLPTEFNLQRIMDDANNSHVDNDINFRYFIHSVRFVNNSSFVVPSNRIQRIQMAQLHRVANTMNVHIVNGGGSEFFWDTNAIFIERNVYLSANAAETFTHEVGHFFGLLHTHFGFNVPCLREPVSRSVVVNPCPPLVSKRCMHTGDLLCSTPADPNMSDDTPPEKLPSNNSCTYVMNETDFYGRVYKPQVSNYMAYGNAGCSATFSDGQKKIMNWFAFHRGLAGDTWLPTEGNKFDRFEPDDADVAARLVPVNTLQTHSFHQDGRTDNSDWYRFQFASSNAVLNYRIEISDVAGSTNPVQEVRLFLRNANGTAGVRIAGVNTFVQNGKRITDIPCALLIPNQNYLIEVTRGATFGRYHFLLTGSETLSIVGPDQVCTNSTFSVSGLPLGTSASWSSNTTSGLTINSTTGVATRVGNFNGQVVITALISGSCLNITFTKSVIVGTPFFQTGSSTLCNSRTSSVFFQSPVSLTWEVLDSFNEVVDGGVGTSFTIYGGTLGVGTFKLRAGQTTCSSRTSWKQTTVRVNNCGSSAMVMLNAYPNPASYMLTIELTDSLSGSRTSNKLDANYQVSIVDRFSQRKFWLQASDKKITIPLENFNADIYYLIISYKEAVLRRQIFIKR
jgi:hypothetical protein